MLWRVKGSQKVPSSNFFFLFELNSAHISKADQEIFLLFIVFTNLTAANMIIWRFQCDVSSDIFFQSNAFIDNPRQYILRFLWDLNLSANNLPAIGLCLPEWTFNNLFSDQFPTVIGGGIQNFPVTTHFLLEFDFEDIIPAVQESNLAFSS